MRQSPTSPLNAAVQEAGRKLQALHMTDIRGCADKVDTANLIDDLDAICRIVDPLIEAIGDYAHETIGVPVSALERFKDQLRGALEGNATFAIEEAGEQAAAYLREAS